MEHATSFCRRSGFAALVLAVLGVWAAGYMVQSASTGPGENPDYVPRVSPIIGDFQLKEGRLVDYRRAPSALIDKRFPHFPSVGELDRAIVHLEEKVALDSVKATALSDLAALYSARAVSRQRPDDYLAALEMAERAHSLAPSLPEATYNRALAFEHLMFYEMASRAWTEYLEIDSQSPWAEEARRMLRRLDGLHMRDVSAKVAAPSVAVRLDRSVHHLEVVTDPQPSDGLRSCTLPDASLKNVRRRESITYFGKGTGAELHRIDLIGSDKAELARALANLDAIHSIQRASRTASDLDDLAWVLSVIRSAQGRSAEALRFHAGKCRFVLGDLAGAVRILEPIGDDTNTPASAELVARSRLTLGEISELRGLMTEALTRYRSALSLFERLGDAVNSVRLCNAIATILSDLGQFQEAWEYRYLALSRSVDPSPALVDALNGAALDSLAQARPRAALVFERRLLAAIDGFFGVESRFLGLRQMALLRCARVESHLGQADIARQDLMQATESVESTDLLVRDRLAAEVDVVGRAILQSENEPAAGWDDESLDGDPGQPLAILSEQVDADFRRGDTRAAEADLWLLLNSLEEQRVKIAPGSLRTSYFDRAWPTYERMAALQIHLGRPEAALEVLERFRARSSLDRFSFATTQAGGRLAKVRARAYSSSAEIQRLLPPHTTVVIYAVIEGRLLTWVVTHSGIKLMGEPPRWDAVSPLIGRLRPEMARDRGAALTLLRQLSGALLAPWAKELWADDRIIFIPTRDLCEVPFAALIDPDSGRFLVRDHAVGIAQSVSQFLAEVKRDSRLQAKPLSNIVLVGDALTNASDGGWLPRLLAAADEIEQVARIYQGLTVRKLTGDAATAENLIESLPDADLVDLAVHSSHDPVAPHGSRLILAAEHGSGDLTVRDILSSSIPNARLVVLATCGSQAGSPSPSEGAVSLASAFLAAGVPAVLGTLWEVEDESAARLDIRFHAEIRRGADPLSALHTAQLAELKSPTSRSDWTWASFQLLGGVAQREPPRL